MTGDVAHVAHPRPLAGSLAALRRLGEFGLLAVAPGAARAGVIGGAIGHRYAFDFHGALWQAARDVLDGRNPYPPRDAPPASRRATASSTRRRSRSCSSRSACCRSRSPRR